MAQMEEGNNNWCKVALLLYLLTVKNLKAILSVAGLKKLSMKN